MNSGILANRLRGGIAACFVEEGLFLSIGTLIFSPNNINLIGIMVVQTFLGVWLFFDRRWAIILGILCKAYFFGFVLAPVLSRHRYPSGSDIGSNSRLFLLLSILQGSQVFVLFWLMKIDRKQIA
jgi:hypothetical protein